MWQCLTIVDGVAVRAHSPGAADLAIAPWLRRTLTRGEYEAPRLGTLIFHPSLLPLHRGPDAVKWSVDRQHDRYNATSDVGGPHRGVLFGGVTWFWCAEGLDRGDICEQEMVAMPYGISPRAFYDSRLVPAGLRTLSRALEALRLGYMRRVPQDTAASTCESWHPSTLERQRERA